LESLNLTVSHLLGRAAKPTRMGKLVVDYFDFWAGVLNNVVEPLLQNAEQARMAFEHLQSISTAKIAIPMNKQSQDKKKPAYFTGIINMLIASNIGQLPCDYNPQVLTTVTRNQAPFRTLARRVDGAFPSPVDPIAVWEIKEYYYTTTFGSRVADGVYETLLDGMELEELDAALAKKAKPNNWPNRIQHLLMVDAHYTWWVKGRSYLCRIIDMLHMGYLDEVLFGKEVLARVPLIAKQWAEVYDAARSGNPI
jgi:hypothetical protein